MIALKVNGVSRQFNGDPDMPLLWYLRDELGLTGSKFGCGESLCGACTVHLGDEAVRSCTTSLADAEGRNITTIEGLDGAGNHPVQRAWRDHNVPQCGYCQSGQIMQAAALLKQNPDPSEEEIIKGMDGNICRCGTYQRIHAAVRTAAKEI
jgi:isoquinoline 1-oxidoreductase alpha subunit